MARLFISQERLDSWSDESRVTLAGDVMTLADDGRSFKLSPAVRFLKVAGNGADAAGLVGKIKTTEALAQAGAEHFVTSVIWRDVAYDVQQGFVGAALRRSGP